MELHFIQAHPQIGKMAKAFGLDGADGAYDKSYPLAGKLKTHAETVTADAAGLADYRALLLKHASLGHALMKHPMRKELDFESRKGMSDNQAKTQLMIIDIDGFNLDSLEVYSGEALSEADVRRCGEALVRELPEQLHNVSYVAVASSSFGRKGNTINMHLHFFLDKPVNPQPLKQWLRSLNYTCQTVLDQLPLIPTMQSMKNIIDPCLGENSRIVYIAPPEFGPHATNPFEDDTQRVALVEKARSTLELNPMLADLNIPKINRIAEEKFKSVCRIAGIRPPKKKTQKMSIDGDTLHVLTNPERVIMEYASHDDQYVRYNIGDSRSSAYWVKRSNPNIVYSFHPEEEPFLFEQADPDTYAWHREKFGAAERTFTVVETGEKRKTLPLAFRDFDTDRIFTAYYDRDRDEIVKMAKTSRDGVKDWLMEQGQPPLDYIPTMRLVFDPSTTKCMFEADGDKRVNTFKATDYMRLDAQDFYDIGYNRTGAIWSFCPRISLIAYHMLGSNDEAFEHFLNWLAYAFQTRSKTRTSWLLQGTEGTGKGLFFKAVLKPLFSSQHSSMKQLVNLVDDKFNDWMQNILLLFVDEFNMNTGKGTTATANFLKNLITESDTPFRAMQVSQVDGTNYVNLIAATNDADALSITGGDRRWNVAPRQECKLDDGYPEFNTQGEKVDAEISDELPVFAEMLLTYKVNVGAVRRTLRNEAKESARVAGMSIQDQFLAAIRAGNLEPFLDILGRKASISNQKEVMLLNAARTVVTNWVRATYFGVPEHVPTDDIRSVYEYLMGEHIKPARMGRMLSAAGIQTSKRRINGTPVSCLAAVRWQSKEDITPYAVQLGLVPNVEPIHTDAPQGEQNECHSQTS